MRSNPSNLDQRIFRSFLSSARTAIAAELNPRVPADQLSIGAQKEIIALLAARAGHIMPYGSLLSDALHEQLAGRLAQMELPYDFLGQAHLDYLSSTIDRSGDRPRIRRNASRKKSGAYYTPDSVVKRIVAETLGRKLAEAANVRQASELRVLDLACGSGAFLREAARLFVQFYAAHGIERAEALSLAAAQVLGAEVSPEAAEIARLSFRVEKLGEPRIIVADSLELDWQRLAGAGNFDVIVGNPPYNAATGLAADTKRYLQNTFESYAGHGDLHYCFFEQALKLLKPGGLLGLLSSAYFMQASHAAGLRKFIIDNATIDRLIDCSHQDLFPGVMIHCMITVLRRDHPQPGWLAAFEPAGEAGFEFRQDELSAAPWIIISNEERRWRQRVESNAVPLGEFCSIVQGPESGLNQAFVVAASYAEEHGLEPEVLRPLIKNSDIGRYAISRRDDLLIYIRRSVQPEQFPAALKHLQQYRKRLQAREICRKEGMPWYALHRPRDSAQMDTPCKIVCPYRAAGNRFAVDERRALNDGGDIRMIFATPDANVDLYFIAALLNSRMMERYFTRVGRKKGKLMEYFKDSLKGLPIRLVPANHPLYTTLGELSRLQHGSFSEQRDYLIERMILDLYELKASATVPGRLF